MNRILPSTFALLVALCTIMSPPAMADAEEEAKHLAGLLGVMDWCKERGFMDDSAHGVLKLAILDELGTYEDMGMIEGGEILLTAKLVNEAGLYRIWKLDSESCENLMNLVELGAWSEILGDD